ncbi:SDR family oxidoreductase [Spongiibacter nanhainus]|uniref:SDR family oxidoreductase n=1 Tax=Spongiibacter nanhainus TaxID=2794344 RepID=A0A7T4R082_9GAMM|nr:SDR family oxidoreductase [Spongiibacter nanhainus]QQD18016.1 SDR family oxidoreductase [Spongiibacter nanhainus]
MLNEMFGLQGRVAVVTGGAKGLGAWMSQALLSVGATVYVTSRKSADCDRFADEMNGRDYQGRCVSLPYDLADLRQIEQFASELQGREQKLDILVNNAGTTWGNALGEFPEKGWDRVMDLNLKAPFFLVQALLPLIKKAGDAGMPARIVNVGSSEGLHAPLLGNYSYSASKAGLHHLTRHLARHLAAEHINVNAIVPGAFLTKMMEQTGPEVMDKVVGEIPLRRMGEQGDIEGAVLLLCSAAGKYVTGAVLPVDGGWSGCL